MENSNQKYSRGQSFFWVVVSYVVGLGVAIGIFYLLAELEIPLLTNLFITDIGYTIIIFIFAYWFKNSSFYDPYWSLIPILIVIFLWYAGILFTIVDALHLEEVKVDSRLMRKSILALLVMLWGVRLTWNWARGWPGIHHEDWRYTDLQKQHGKRYWLVSFFGIMLFPTILVFVGCLPFFPVMTDVQYEMNWIDVFAIIVTLTGITFEFFADNQLRNFVLTNKEKGKSLTAGLWKYSRHPNYFGEVTFWWGIFLFGLAANPSYWWTIIGAISMTALFHFISIPMIEKRHWERKKDYGEVVVKVPRWIPWFPKK